MCEVYQFLKKLIIVYAFMNSHLSNQDIFFSVSTAYSFMGYSSLAYREFTIKILYIGGDCTRD